MEHKQEHMPKTTTPTSTAKNQPQLFCLLGGALFSLTVKYSQSNTKEFSTTLASGDFRKNYGFKSYGVKTKSRSQYANSS